MLKKNPLIMSLNLDRKLFVTKLVPVDKAVNNWKELRPYEEQNPLPFHHDRALSFAPFGVIITTNEVVQAIRGWQVVESPIRSPPPAPRGVDSKNQAILERMFMFGAHLA